MESNQIVLQKTSNKIKNVVIELSDQILQQELIIEGLDNETKRNSNLMVHNLQKFEKLLLNMSRDPRNNIIFFLIIMACILSIYLLY